MRLAVQPHDAPDHVRARAEPLLPQTIAEDRHTRRIGAFFALVKRSAARGRDAEHVEEVRVDERAGNPLRIAAARQRIARVAISGEPGEAVIAFTPVEKIRGARVAGALLRLTIRVSELHQRIRIAERQRPQQHLIDDAEDCAVRAHANRHRRDREHDEAGRMQKRPDGVAEVLLDGVDH